jgi:hypothetical protein
MTPKQLKKQIRDVEFAIKAFKTKIESVNEPTTLKDDMHLQNLISTKHELISLKEELNL